MRLGRLGVVVGDLKLEMQVPRTISASRYHAVANGKTGRRRDVHCPLVFRTPLIPPKSFSPKISSSHRRFGSSVLPIDFLAITYNGYVMKRTPNISVTSRIVFSAINRKVDYEGGDEARVARARGSGRGALPSPILANGTLSSRVSPPRAGWAVRTTEATLTPTSSQRPSVPDTSSTSVERWASERTAPVWSDRAAASLSAAAAAAAATTATNTRGGSFSAADRGPASTAGIRLEHRWIEERKELEATKKVEHWQQQQCQDQCQQRRHLQTSATQSPGAAGLFELSGRPMSRSDAISPPTRPPSSRTNITGDGNDDCISGAGEDADSRLVHIETRVHDHSRPFPPPRLPLVHMTTMPSVPPPPPPPPASQSVPGSPTLCVAPLTMPLTPLSSSFRSRPSLRRPQNVETSPSDANSRSLLSPSSTDTTITTIATSPRSPIGEVSLATPRPDGERTINEYVETPFKNSRCSQERRLDADSKTAGDCPKNERRHHHHHHHHHHHRGHDDSTVVPTHRGRGRARNQSLRGFSGSTTGGSPVATSTNTAAANAVTKQPVSFTKEPANTLGTRTYDPAGLSIICDFCGRCRCESCREPPPLPSKWLCDNTCLCSAETVLDYASCLCCVKGLFYHCVDSGSGGGVDSSMNGEAATSCADEPCSCTGNRVASRWACLGALSLVMPCLLCYWPLRGCVTLCEACYARHAAQGCRCNPNVTGSRHHPITSDIGDSRDPEKRLLDPVTPEL
ncbi:SPY protein, partial [Pseudoatta argentina]